MESKSDRPVDWTLLTRYVSGDCSEEEEVVVETWAATDPNNRRLLQELRGTWEKLSRWEDTLPVDVDAAWSEFDRRIRDAEDKEAPPKQGVASGDRPARRSRRRSRRARSRAGLLGRTLYGWAGVVGVVVSVALTVFAVRGLSGDEEALEKKVYTTERGQRAVVQLVDGTEVHLNVDSRLALPEGGFSPDSRAVRFEGEGYFEVARDTTRPFRVEVQGASVRVLGTSFDVEAYPDDSEARVMVTEGEVALQSDRMEARDTVVIGAQYLGVTSGQRGWDVRRGVDLSRELAWTEGKLAFRDAPFEKVIRKLRRWYDLRIETDLPSEAVGRLNATVDGESPDNTLQAVAAALDLQYERSGQTVTYYR